jgi:serine/threonine protein kinase
MKFTFAPESRPLDGFTIKRAIARGGFGEVYYALTDSGKEVAIKLLQDNLEVELRGVTQCLNLKHPNLVTLFDIKQDTEGDHWIVMEYVGGKTLDRVIHEHVTGLPLNEVLAWLDGIAAGIGFLHDRGIVHRDLKPANIFRENGVVKVGDVGLSKFIAPSRRSAHTQSVGTVYYMAPEVAKGRYGREVDVYSLAVILYELLTGKVPFDGETTAEILMKHLTERPNLATVSPNLRPIFEAALEKDPQRRTSDVLELARLFRAAATNVNTSEALRSGNASLGMESSSDFHEIHAERLRICSQLRVLLDQARELETDADRDRNWSVRQPQIESLARQAQELRASADHRDRRLWDYSAEGTFSALTTIADKFRKLANPHLPVLDVADTQPFERPVVDRPAPRPSRFPNSSQPRTGWEAFCRSCGDWVRGGRTLVREHPLLAWLVFGSFLVWFLPRVPGANFARVGGGTRLVWLVFGGIAAFEVFRLVSRGVDLIFAPESTTTRGQRGTRLNERGPHDTSTTNSNWLAGSPFGRAAYRAVNPNSVREISWRRRITELSGSLATAGLATAIVTAVLAYVTQFFGTTALIGQFAAGTLIGSWGLLIVGKLREGLPRERYIDRMLLAGVGVLVGLALFELDGWLLIDLPADGWSQKQSLLAMTSASLSDSPRHILAESYVAFFATLFFFRRWWWHTDSFRPHRFQVLSVCLTAIVGAIAARAWGFPVLWGTVWAASLSSVVQLAAVWTPREQRR